MLQAHAEETLNRWLEMERVEHEYRRWAAFFYPLMDKPELGQLLCEVGLSVISRQIPAGAEALGEAESRGPDRLRLRLRRGGLPGHLHG